MGLKILLDQNNWEDSSLDYSFNALDSSLRESVESSIGDLFKHYYKSIILNTILLLVTVSIYFFRPSNDVLVPVLIIGGVFGFLAFSVIWQLLFLKKPDMSASLHSVIQQILEYNKRINIRLCNYTSLIVSTSFAGGFLLGLVLQGWSLEKIFYHPVLMPIYLILTVGIHLLARKQVMNNWSRVLNPKYHKTKEFLEAQLNTLETE